MTLKILPMRFYLERSIADGNNDVYWIEGKSGYDLRSPAFRTNLEAVCQQMSLDIEKLPAKF